MRYRKFENLLLPFSRIDLSFSKSNIRVEMTIDRYAKSRMTNRGDLDRKEE